MNIIVVPAGRLNLAVHDPVERRPHPPLQQLQRPCRLRGLFGPNPVPLHVPATRGPRDDRCVGRCQSRGQLVVERRTAVDSKAVADQPNHIDAHIGQRGRATTEREWIVHVKTSQARLTSYARRNMFPRHLMTAALAFLMSVVAAAFSVAPAAAGSAVPQSDLAYIRSAMAKYGVPAEQQNALIKAYAAGARWDSQSGATPVATEVSKTGGVERTIYRYKDGSVNVSEGDIPSAIGTGDIGVNAIGECQGYAKTGWWAWRNCKVSWDALTWSMRFIADVSVVVGPPYPPVYQCSIDYIRGLQYGGAGNFSNGALEYITKTAYGYSSQCIARGIATQSIPPYFTDIVGVNIHVSAEGALRGAAAWSSLVP
jgi:hypothetical protein